MVVEEQIPESLEQPVEAALAWFNAREEEVFQVTGMVDPDRAPASKAPRTLRLILCAGDRCEQRSFRVSKQGSVFDVEMIEGDADAGGGLFEPRLDPPPGARMTWLDQVLGRHAFVVLVFYRGFW